MDLKNISKDTSIMTERGELVTDPVVLGILEQILTTLKKIEYHLSIASDVELNDQDV